MAIKSLLGFNETKPSIITDKSELLSRFESQECITISTGTTCAFLGDERNLREFLVASEAAKLLRDHGHVVHHLLFDDDLDPLNDRQLRVAVNKNQAEIERFSHYCGKPVSKLPSPDGSPQTWSSYYEEQFLQRLSGFKCYPHLIKVSKLYEGGIYNRYVRIALERHKDIERFITKTFPNYTPQALFHPICPVCGSIAGARLTHYNSSECAVSCAACDLTSAIPAHNLRGKMNWKLDCAARWHYFNIDIEPFSKAYLDPNAGAYEVARAVGTAFFGSPRVHPLLIGTVKVDRDVSSDALSAVPREVVDHLMTDKWSTDLHVSRERIRVASARKGCESSIVNFVKQDLPKMAVRKSELPANDFAKVAQAEKFAQHFLDQEVSDRAPNLDVLRIASTQHLKALQALLVTALKSRRSGSSYELFDLALKESAATIPVPFKELSALVREIVNNHCGLPLRRLLYSISLADLTLIEFAVKAMVESRAAKAELARLQQQSAFVLSRDSMRLDTDSIVVIA